MAVTLSANLTEINDCDVLGTVWTSLEVIGVDTESKREGTGSIAIQKVSQETSYAQYDYYTDHANAYLNITGETHIYFWTQSRQRLDTKANGGIRIRLTDASANYREWWVGGSDNYFGGFQNFVIYTGTAPNASSGTLNLAQIRYITFYWKVLSKTIVAANDCFVDIIYYGTGIIVGGGTSGDKGTFDQIITADETPAYGVLSKKFGVFMAQGPITFGDSTGATTTYFSDSNQIVLFVDALVSSTHYAINVVGNATGTNSVQFGSVTGSGSSMVGSEGIVFKSVNTSLPFQFNAANANINEFKLYGNTFINASDVFLGSSTTLLGGSGTTVDLVDNEFSNPTQVFRNISGSAAVTALRNSIVSANDSRASMDLYDGTATTSNQWTIIEGKGYEDSTGGATTITVTGEPFPNTAANKPYVTVTDSAQVFNLNDVNNGSGGRPSVTDQTELAFDGNANGQVKENYVVTWSVKTPGGTALENARAKITESAPSAAIANQNNTNSSGAASSTYLRALYVPSGASTLTVTTHTPQAFKTYKYGYLPNVSSATIDQPVTNNIAMLTDSFQVETTQATAIYLGDTTRNVQIIDDRAATDYILILKYTGGSNTLTAGQTILSSGSGTWRGVVRQIIEGNSTAGTIVVRYSSGVVFSDSAGTLDNTPSSGIWTATYTTTSVKRFAMGIDADTLTAQQLYDYVNAKLADTTLDTSKNFDDMVIWGKSSEGIPIQGIGSKFKTVRNDSTSQQGWVIWNLEVTAGLGNISSYMANDGTTFTPAATVTLEVNGVKTGSEPTNYVRVRIEAAAGGPLSAGTTIMNTQATTSYGSSGFYKATASFTYTSDQPVVIRTRYKGYVPFETTGTITSSGLTVTAVWLPDPNYIG